MNAGRCVIALCDPDTEAIHWVGPTSLDPTEDAARLQSNATRNREAAPWVASLGERRPLIVRLSDWLLPREVPAHVRAWKDALLDHGAPLVQERPKRPAPDDARAAVDKIINDIREQREHDRRVTAPTIDLAGRATSPSLSALRWHDSKAVTGMGSHVR